MPENRADPDSRLIALPVTRIRARSAHPGEPDLPARGRAGHHATWSSRRRAGSPATTTSSSSATAASTAPSRLDCPEVVSALQALGRLPRRDVACGRTADGLPGLRRPPAGRRRRPRRLHAARARRRPRGRARARWATSRIDLFSESAGTRTAMIYALAPPAEHPPLGDDRASTRPGTSSTTRRRRTRRSAATPTLCAQDGRCSARTDDLAASMRRDRRGHARPLARSCRSTRATSSSRRSSASWSRPPHAAPLSAPMTIDAWLSAAKGDASGFWFQSLAAPTRSSRSRSSGATWERPRGPMSARRSATSRRPASSRLDPRQRRHGVHLGRRPLANAWPANPDDNQYSRVRDSKVPTLLIGGTLDFATPAAERDQGAAAVSPERPPGGAAGARAHDRRSGTTSRRRARGLLNTFLDDGQGRRLALHHGDGRLHARASRTPRSARASPGRWSASR